VSSTWSATSTVTLRARAVHLDPRTTPEGYVGIAQHLTREYTLGVAHPNGARQLASVLIEAADYNFDTIVDRCPGSLR
jgi:hypothetical protein